MSAAFYSAGFLDQELGQNEFLITLIQVEETTSVQNQQL